MKPKIILLAISLFGFAVAKANTDPAPCTDKKRVDEVSGVIVNAESKKPLKDVSITAYLVSKKEKSIVTDDEGNFAFDELKPGTYRFIFEKAGFKRVTKEKVVIKTDETFQLNIEMIESKDSDLMPSPFHF
ncbi:MAG TPA: carboxypeptidase-like regulatory domain-containing protein [Chitinophagaceae bacterium]